MIALKVRHLNGLCIQEPQKHVLVMHGDFNLVEPDESSIILDSKLTQKPKQKQLDNARAFRSVIEGLIYIDTGAYFLPPGDALVAVCGESPPCSIEGKLFLNPREHRRF